MFNSLGQHLSNIPVSIEKELKALSNRIEDRALFIMRGYIPVDTHNLQAQIISRYERNIDSIEIEILIRNKQLVYKKNNINSIALATILNIGQRKSSKGLIELRRRKSNKYKLAGEKTEQWFEEAIKHIEKEVLLIFKQSKLFS